MTQKDISIACRVSVSGFRRYIQTYHRDVMISRHLHGKTADAKDIVKWRSRTGQGYETEIKYKEAIKACTDMKYIQLTISEIAHIFNLNPSGLNNQLRTHFPNILAWRYNEQVRRGLNTYRQLDHMKKSENHYRDAVELFRHSELTIKEIAQECAVSFSGLRQHLLFYHKDLVKERQKKRISNKGQKVQGRRNGNNGVHCPSPATEIRFAETLELYKTSHLTIKEICKETNVSVGAFTNYLRVWHRDLMLQRKHIQGVAHPSDVNISSYKHYLACTAAKYEQPIQYLKMHHTSTAAVARMYRLNAESFRRYLWEHEPALAASLGFVTLSNGRTVSRKSYEKYKDAVAAYTSSDLSMKAIAESYGLVYNSFSAYIRRNYPQSIATHSCLSKTKS